MTDIDAEVRNLLQSDSWVSKEFLNNKISRYSVQNGKCYITGRPPKACEAHTHHLRPKVKGGGDEYRNLIILHEDARGMIHATTQETVSEYAKSLALAKEQLRKLNKFRGEAGKYALITA